VHAGDKPLLIRDARREASPAEPERKVEQGR
jgi:hypothetical protein